MAKSTTIDIGQVITELEQNCIVFSKLLGPTEGKVLMEDTSGNVLVTNDGCTILSAITLTNPVARMIINACKEHHKQYGDGAKTMLLMVQKGLRYLNQNELVASNSLVDKQTHARQQTVLSLSFLNNILKCHKFMTWFSAKHAIKCQSSDSKFWNNVKALIGTSMNGKFSKATVSKLNDFAVNLLRNLCSGNGIQLQSTLTVYMRNYDQLVVEVTGLHVDNSRILEGVLLHRSCGVLPSKETELECNAVFVQWDGAFQTETEALFDYTNSKHSSLLTFPTKLCTEWLQNIKTFNVRVIFYQGKGQQTFHTLCSIHDITLFDCMPLDELKELAVMFNVQPVQDITESVSGKMILKVKLNEIQIGSNRYLHVVEPNEQKIHTLVLCSPSPGLCMQYKNAVYNSILIIKLWLENTYGSSKQLSCVQGCGKFYMQMKDIIQKAQLIEHVLDRRFTEVEQNYLTFAKPIVCEMLLEIPKTLHYNDYNVKDKQNRFLWKHYQCNNDFTSIDDNSQCKVLHSLTGQLAVISDAINAICEVAKVEAILSVTSGNMQDLEGLKTS